MTRTAIGADDDWPPPGNGGGGAHATPPGSGGGGYGGGGEVPTHATLSITPPTPISIGQPKETLMAQNAHPFFPWLTAPRRAYLYRLSVAVLPILVAYGLIADHDAAKITGLVLALLDVSVAAMHTPKD